MEIRKLNPYGLAAHSGAYQLDFLTPGISPCKASERKHKRQIWNFLKKARGRPQILQRLCCCTPNFGFLRDLAMEDVFAMFSF